MFMKRCLIGLIAVVALSLNCYSFLKFEDFDRFIAHKNSCNGIKLYERYKSPNSVNYIQFLKFEQLKDQCLVHYNLTFKFYGYKVPEVQNEESWYYVAGDGTVLVDVDGNTLHGLNAHTIILKSDGRS